MPNEALQVERPIREPLDTHMGESPRQTWARMVVLLGIGYAFVGIVFAMPATHVQGSN